MERLQKLLARAGVASRRESEKLICAGRVSVNGRVVTELGAGADPAVDAIAVDGAVLSFDEPMHYLALNKPAGYVTSRSDTHDRPTVMSLIPEQLRPFVVPVGRLDLDSEGLLLLTSDGRLTHALTHPSFGVPKTYLATVRGHVTRDGLRALTHGVELEDGPATAADARIERRAGNNCVLRIVLTEGRKREVKRMCEAIGHRVVHLRRIAFGPIEIGSLPLGRHRNLSDDEVNRLYKVTRLRRGRRA
ncbi:MAG TPA: pseudouridine synthase [Armatimonadetes bacterium]|nr:pseudouridine synthase [Armatimonadota bacterium]